MERDRAPLVSLRRPDVDVTADLDGLDSRDPVTLADDGADYPHRSLGHALAATASARNPIGGVRDALRRPLPIVAAGSIGSPQAQGAATSVLLATAPELDGDSGGRYFEDCHEAQIVPQVTDGLHGVRAWAMDPTAAARLWDVSMALIDAECRRLDLT